IQQQQQAQQQHMLMTAAAMTPGIGGVRPIPASVVAMQGLQPGMSPQQQLQQLQIQQQQQQQRSLLTSGVRPPPLGPAGQQQQQLVSPPAMSAGPQLVQGIPNANNRAAGTTPTPTSGGGSQRGLKRKSVNNSPAPNAQHSQQPLTKSPRVMSPPSGKPQLKRPGSAVNSSPLAHTDEQT
ncbi:hypothetical protein GGI11_009155, partial [Coemansia sp. RSA 2049]